MNLNQAIVYRKVRNTFDYLSDVGGLQAILVTVISIFLNACKFNLFDNYMVSQLFSEE